MYIMLLYFNMLLKKSGTLEYFFFLIFAIDLVVNRLAFLWVKIKYLPIT